MALVSPLMLAGTYAAPDVAVHEVADLDLFFQDMAMSLSQRRTMRLNGFLNTKNLEENIEKSNCFDYATTWQYLPAANGGLQFSLAYLDSTRLLAAYFNPKLVKELSTQERLALAELKKRAARFNFDGLTRQEIVKILMDDTRLRTQKVSPNARGKGSCVELILHKRANPESFARYVFVLMSMYDIPCRIVRLHGWMCWNMIQLEDGGWYCLDSGVGTDGAVFGSRPLPPELEERYPASPGELPAPLPWSKSLKAFWTAAGKACAAGQPAYGAVVRKFPGKKGFMQSLEKYVAEGNEMQLADMYLPAAAGRNVYVRVVFDHAAEAESNEGTENAEDAEGLIEKGNKAIRKFKKLLDDDE